MLMYLQCYNDSDGVNGNQGMTVLGNSKALPISVLVFCVLNSFSKLFKKDISLCV